MVKCLWCDKEATGVRRKGMPHTAGGVACEDHRDDEDDMATSAQAPSAAVDPAMALMATKTGQELAELMRAGTGQLLLRLQVALRRGEDLERDLAAAKESIRRLETQAAADGKMDAENAQAVERMAGRLRSLQNTLAEAVGMPFETSFDHLVRRAIELHKAWRDTDIQRRDLAIAIGCVGPEAAPSPSWGLLKDASRQTREQLAALRERMATENEGGTPRERRLELAKALGAGPGCSWEVLVEKVAHEHTWVQDHSQTVGAAAELLKAVQDQSRISASIMWAADALDAKLQRAADATTERMERKASRG